MIGPDGAQLGIMSSRDALNLAAEKKSRPCQDCSAGHAARMQIIDYGKYRFEQAKREKEARKNQRVVEIKEIRLSLNIDTHDFETKKNHASRFLSEGNKVKVSIRFRGRDGSSELGADIMKRFAEALAEIANVEKPAKLEGSSMLMFLAPKPVK